MSLTFFFVCQQLNLELHWYKKIERRFIFTPIMPTEAATDSIVSEPNELPSMDEYNQPLQEDSSQQLQQQQSQPAENFTNLHRPPRFNFLRRFGSNVSRISPKLEKSNSLFDGETRVTMASPNFEIGDDEDNALSMLVDESDSDSDLDNEPEYDPNDVVSRSSRSRSIMSRAISRVETIRKNVEQKSEKIGFFDPEFKANRAKIYVIHIHGILVILALILGIFSLFWGSFYHRERRLTNLSFAVIRDDPTIYQKMDIEDVFSNTLTAVIRNPKVHEMAGWKPRYYTNYTDDPSQLLDVFHEHIYRQTYWGLIWVRPNASLDYYNALQTGDEFNFTDVYTYMIETGRHYTGMNSYVSKSIETLQAAVCAAQPKTITKPMAQNLSKSQLVSSVKSFAIPIVFNGIDLTPISLRKPDRMGPQQFGPIYLQVLALMQVAFFVPHQRYLGKKLSNGSFIAFKVLTAHVSYLLIGLAYTLVQIAFNIDIYSAYPGKAGFVVFWIVTSLTLAALCGVNENVAMLIKCYCPNMIPSWVMFWIAINVAPTVFPLCLAPKFYRYAYGMPIFNGNELFRILLFDTYKQVSLTRNIFVLMTYYIICLVSMPFCLRLLIQKMNSETQRKVSVMKNRRREALRRKTKRVNNVLELHDRLHQQVNLGLSDENQQR